MNVPNVVTIESLVIEFHSQSFDNIDLDFEKFTAEKSHSSNIPCGKDRRGKNTAVWTAADCASHRIPRPHQDVYALFKSS